MFREQAEVSVRKIIVSNYSGVLTASIDVDQYLDYLDTLFSNFDWATSSWADRLKSVFSIGEIVVEFYKDLIDETSEDQEQCFVDVSFVGWKYIKEKFNIKLPIFISPFENKIIETIVRAAVKFALDRIEKLKK